MWARLFRCATAEDAVREIATWLDPAGRVHLDIAEARGGAEHPGSVPGAPPWVVVATEGGVERPELAERAAARLAAWRAARIEIARREGRWEARRRDVEALHHFGRSLAECRSLDSLFESAAEAIHRQTGADVVAFAHDSGGGPAVDVWASTSLPTAEVAAAAGGWSGGLEWLDDTRPAIRVRPLAAHGEAEARAPEVAHDAVVLPIARHGRAVANLVVALARPPGERLLGLLFGAANQLALNLDRVLGVAEAEQGRFREILDSMSQAVVLADRTGRILQANGAAAGLAPRVTRPDGKALVDRLGDLDLRDLARRAAIEGASPVAGEARLEDGSRLAVTASTFAGSGPDGGLVFVFTDVTEARRLEEQVARSERLSSLGRLISGVAHELNNPLAAVVGFSQLLRTTPPGEGLERRLDVIAREAERCAKIVRTLLSFARRYEPERRPFSLNEVVESVVDLMRYQLRVSGLDVVVDVDPGLPRVMGDSHEMQQAVLNLVTNAQQAIAASGRRGTVTIATRLDPAAGTILEVGDDGPGIPESIRSRVFDPFFTTKPPGQGTGLGLSLVFGTVEAHGGSIELDTHEGLGSVFRIRLPAAGAGTTTSPAPADETTDGARGTASGKILVVDDEVGVASLICEALGACGYETVAASTADDVLRRIGSDEYDLVVSDLRMAGLGAERLLAELRRRRPGSERCVLLTSGDSLSREPEALASAIGAEVLHKPFGVDDLLRSVRRRLRAAHESGP